MTKDDKRFAFTTIEEKQEALVSCIFAGFSEDEKKNFAAYNTRLYQNVMSHLK